MKNSKNLISEANSNQTGLKKKAEGKKGSSIDKAQEGTKLINQKVERIAGKTPSLHFTGAAFASILIFMFFQIRGKRDWGLFISQWVPTILLFALYKKVSKALLLP